MQSSALRRELDGFELSTRKVVEKFSGVSDSWKDNNFTVLQEQVRELAKKSKTVIDYGERACSSTDKFFAIAAEEV